MADVRGTPHSQGRAMYDEQGIRVNRAFSPGGGYGREDGSMMKEGGWDREDPHGEVQDCCRGWPGVVRHDFSPPPSPLSFGFRGPPPCYAPLSPLLSPPVTPRPCLMPLGVGEPHSTILTLGSLRSGLGRHLGSSRLLSVRG